MFDQIRRNFSWLALGFVFCAVVALGGCKAKDDAAAKACEEKAAEMKDGAECEKCCKEAGASGHSYSNFTEAECKCL